MERTVALFEDPDAGELSKNHPPDEKDRINITDRAFVKELSKPEHSLKYPIYRVLGPRSAEKLGLIT